MNLGRLIIPAIVLVVAVGGFLFRDRLSGNAGDLQVGDCFDVPTGETIKDVQHQPCTDPHDGEIFWVGDYTGGDTFPAETEFQAFVRQNCLGQSWTDYVGRTADASTDIELGAFWPTSEGWKGGDKEVACYLTPADGSKISSSYRAAPAAS